MSAQKDSLEQLATFLKNFEVSWQETNQEQRNQLARTLFEKIRVENHEIRGITPTSEFIPLLTLSSVRQCMADTEVTGIALSCATYLRLHERQEIIDPLLVYYTIMQQIKPGKQSHLNCQRSIDRSTRTQIPKEMWFEVAQRHSNGESLRQLAEIYKVSHEAVRRVVKRLTQSKVLTDKDSL